MTLDAVPENGDFVPVDTRVFDDSDLRSLTGIRIGDEVYWSPPIYRNSFGEPIYTSDSSTLTFRPTWQVVAVSRSSLEPLPGWNRTYGACGSAACWIGEDGTVHRTNRLSIDGDISALGSENLVAAANHREFRGQWSRPNDDVAFQALNQIADMDSWVAAQGDASAAVIGSPGNFRNPFGHSMLVDGEGDQQIRGYLSRDQNENYGFTPALREEFDTRESVICAGECSVTQTVAGNSLTGELQNGEAGYMVSALDRFTGRLLETKTFATYAAGGNADEVEAMENFLSKWTDVNELRHPGELFAITSVHTPGAKDKPNVHPAVGRETWRSLAAWIARVGGTRNEFNAAAASPGTDYSLIGWGNAQEANGSEATGPEVRLRGALAPGHDMQLRPRNVSSGGPPAEKLNQLLVRPPSTDWDPGGSEFAGERRAISDLGVFMGLGSDPRASYALTLQTDEDATDHTELLNETTTTMAAVKARAGTPDSAYDQADFDAAKGQLAGEIDRVGRVRNYLQKLATPAAAVNQSAWEDASILQNRLKTELDYYKKDASLRFDPLGALYALIDFAGAAFGDPDAAEIIQVLAGLDETAEFFYNADYDGSADIDKNPRIKADQLAQQLQQQARNTTLAYRRIGDVIVSDPVKLAEVGTYANCAFNACPAGFQEYSTDHLEGAAAYAGRSLDRTIYEQLVPLSFQAWDTGLTKNPDPFNNWGCRDSQTPFDQSKPRTWFKSFEEFDPGGSTSRWRVFVMTHRVGLYYYEPDDEILKRMFDPVSPDNDPTTGLGISPAEFFPRARPPYEPGVTCYWYDN